jgi:hypothetical protein
MPESASALYDAARLLIGEASPGVVRTVLRLLLDEATPQRTPVERPQPPSAPLASAHPTRKRAARRVRATNNADDAWNELRKTVRATMRERGTSYADLAVILGCAETTAKVQLSCSRPASQRLITGLRSWLETAPKPAEAAESGAPFHPAAAGLHARGNGSRQPAAGA